MALVMLATFCFMSSNMLANPIVAGYAESLGASGMLMGVVAGSMSFISLFCRPIAGNLSDRTSKRTLVAAGTVLYFAAGLLYYFADSPIMLIMARVINGVGFACCSVCLATWMSLLLPIRHMGAGMGLYGTMNALAMAVGPAFGIRTQKYIGYRLTFLSSLVLAAIMLIATVVSRRYRQISRRIQGMMGSVTGTVEESVGAHREVRIYGGQQHEAARFDEVTHRARRLNLKIAATNALSTSTVQIVAAFAIASVIFVITLLTGFAQLWYTKRRRVEL